MGDPVTLLDQFAMAALPAIIESYDRAAIQDKVSLGTFCMDQIAQDSYAMARAMMDERERPSIPLPVRGEAGFSSGRPPRPA